MSYSIQQRDGKFCVVDTDSGTVHGCHETEGQAQDQMQAIGMHAGKTLKDALQDCLSRKVPHLIQAGYPRNQAVAIAYSECGEKAFETLPEPEQAYWLGLDYGEPKHKTCPACTTHLKALGENRVGGYGVVWGDAARTDLAGDYFTPGSYFGFDLPFGQAVEVSLPWYYDHAQAELPPGAQTFADARDFQVGRVVKALKDDIGIWIEAQVENHNDWVAYVLDLIDRGALAWSSGSVPHLVKRMADGWLKSWPIVEWSSTPTPAEPRHTGLVVLKHFVYQAAEPEPEGVADQAAQGQPGAPDSISPIAHATQHERKPNMAMEIETKAAALVTLHWDTMEAALKQGNAIQEAAKPLASQLSELAGIPEEEALSIIVGVIAQYAAPTPAPDTPEMPDEGGEAMDENAAQLSIDVDALADAVAEKMTQKFSASKTGALLTPRFPTVIVRRPDDQPPSLIKMLRAVAHHDHATLRRENRKSFESYIKRYGAGYAYKALGIDPDTAGGYLVPEERSSQIIGLLHDESVLASRITEMPMSGNTLSIPRVKTGVTVGWVGENAQLPDQADASFGEELLVAKKMYVKIFVSNELMADSDPSVDAWLQQEIVSKAAEEYDRVILRGAGVGAQPQGVLNRALVNKVALNAAPTYANLVALQTRLKMNKVRADQSVAWVLNPRDTGTLRSMVDSEGHLIWTGSQGQGSDATMGQPPILLGWPVLETNQLDIDAVNNSETEIFGGKWSDVVVGMRKALEIMSDASIRFDYDQTVFRAILRMDVGMRYDQAVEILTDVRAS